MKSVIRTTAVLAIAGSLAAAAATPGEARGGRNTAAAVGFAAGALIGAAAANAHSNYNYAPGPSYYYAPSYEPYAYYEPTPVYVAPAPHYRGGSCWVATGAAYGYWGSCATPGASRVP